MAENTLAFMKKHSLKEGDVVEIAEKKGNAMKGTIIPSTDEKLLALKLENGYNVGISIEKISSVKKLGAGRAVGKAKALEIRKKPGLPSITILHTGGTIASRVDYRTGGVYAAFGADDLLAMFPELGEMANFDSRLVSNMMSEDMRFSNYQEMAKAVSGEIKKGAKGVIIGHGTDTLAVTAAALSFVLENCPIPVLLVGAQRSSDRGSSDAGMNLICAAHFIAKTDFAGVAICMHHSDSDGQCAILPACKTRKLHTSRRDAFKAVNGMPIALIDYKTRKTEFLKKDYEKAGTGKTLVVKDKFEEKTGLLKTHVNMHQEEFDFFQKNGYRGFVLEATGIGQAPTNTKENEENYNSLKKFIAKGGLVALTSQCIFGRVHPTIYKNCRRLADIGVVFCEDMLTETAFVKLAWLLGNFPAEEAAKLMAKNLRGEIGERTEIGEFNPN